MVIFWQAWTLASVFGTLNFLQSLYTCIGAGIFFWRCELDMAGEAFLRATEMFDNWWDGVREIVEDRRY